MSFSKQVRIIRFDRTRRAYCFFTTEDTRTEDIISSLPLTPLPKGIVCISGGATKFPPDTIKKTIRLTEFAIAPVVFQHDLLIVDGGTKAGVMQITGMVLRKVKYGTPPIQVLTSFKLTHQALENLKNEKLPNEILEALALLEEQKFSKEDEFLNAIKKQIGQEQIVCYKDLILKHAQIHNIFQDNPQTKVFNFENLPIIGFVPESKVVYPGVALSPQRDAELDFNHTYSVLVQEAQDWGGEVERMFTFIDYWADVKHHPIVHIIANGGRITIKEIYHSIQQGYHIIVLEGSARATKVIVAALDGVSETGLVDLLRQHEIATQVHEVEETLSWLKEIVEYNKITRFDFWSGHHEELKKIILSRLGFE